MDGINKYRFSFTAASLMPMELIEYAKILVGNGFIIDDLQHQSLNKDKAKTGKREFAELKIRLSTLSKDELLLLAESDIATQKLISYIACCRAYSYIREFVMEVVLEKVSLFDLQITEIDYNAFFNKKCIDHDELEDLAITTKAKIKQVVFKILQQAGFIDSVKSKKIIIPIVDTRLENIIKETNPSDLVLLLMRQFA
jgi:hypothetical protein